MSLRLFFSALLFLTIGCAYASDERYDAITKECHATGTLSPACYSKYLKQSSNELNKLLLSISSRNSLVSKFLKGNQKKWSAYVTEWCEDSVSMDGDIGVAQNNACLIYFTLARIRDLREHYCEFEDCPRPEGR